MDWLLLMVFLSFEHPDVALGHFGTQAACQVERNRIGFAMAAAYDQDISFRIECRKMKKVV